MDGSFLAFVQENIFLFVILILLIALFVSNEVTLFTRKYKVAAPRQAIDMINRESALVLDVRDAADFKKGSIVNSRNVPMSQLESKLSSLEDNSDNPIIVVCNMGQSSGRAATTMAKQGFKQVFVLKGGLEGWKAEGLPLSRPGGAKGSGKKGGKKGKSKGSNSGSNDRHNDTRNDDSFDSTSD